jgi:hypothetical protein
VFLYEDALTAGIAGLRSSLPVRRGVADEVGVSTSFMTKSPITMPTTAATSKASDGCRSSHELAVAALAAKRDSRESRLGRGVMTARGR